MISQSEESEPKSEPVPAPLTAPPQQKNTLIPDRPFTSLAVLSTVYVPAKQIPRFRHSLAARGFL